MTRVDSWYVYANGGYVAITFESGEDRNVIQIDPATAKDFFRRGHKMMQSYSEPRETLLAHFIEWLRNHRAERTRG